jgi:hypothetical protein
VTDEVLLLQSTLTCPACGAHITEIMPPDLCQYFYDCPACAALLKPKPGDCCVFCSYGDAPCPPIQAARASGDAPDGPAEDDSNATTAPTNSDGSTPSRRCPPGGRTGTGPGELMNHEIDVPPASRSRRAMR